MKRTLAVLDRGVPKRKERREDDARPPKRYIVVEYDDDGPIMRAGPYRYRWKAERAAREEGSP